MRISAAEETSTTTCHYPCRGGPWMHLLSRSQNFKAYVNVENGSAIQRNHDARGKVPALKTATCCGPCWRGPWALAGLEWFCEAGSSVGACVENG